MRKLPGEIKTEEYLFSVMFKESIKRLGWTWVLIETAEPFKKLFFGPHIDINNVMKHDNFVIAEDPFTKALHVVLKEEIKREQLK